jgi:hypothetical protein
MYPRIFPSQRMPEALQTLVLRRMWNLFWILKAPLMSG